MCAEEYSHGYTTNSDGHREGFSSNFIFSLRFSYKFLTPPAPVWNTDVTWCGQPVQ